MTTTLTNQEIKRLLKTPEKLSVDDLRFLQREAERNKVRSDLMYLAREYLGYEDLNDDLHGWIASELEETEVEKNKCFLLPRGHLKSSFITVAWTIQQILRDPNIRVGIVNAVFSKSIEFLAEIKDHLENPKLVALFPDILYENPRRDTLWREDRIIVKRTKVRSGYTVNVSSIEGAMTGKHFEIMIFDDIQGADNVASRESIQKVINKFKLSRSILEPGGIRLVVGTRWKKEDFYNWYSEQDYPMVVRSAIEDGNVIFPDKFSLKELAEIKKEQGAYMYSCQYENNPLPEEDQVFKEKWIQYYTEPVKYTKIYILVDPALSKSKKADESVICVVAQPEQNELPLHVMKSRGIGYESTGGNIQVVVDAILYEYTLALSFTNNIIVGIEDAGFQDLLKRWIYDEMKRRRLYFNIEPLKHKSRKKDDRIRRLQPLFERGGIRLKKSETESLVSQLLDFGSTLHDDHADALAYLMDVLDEGAQTGVRNYVKSRFRQDESLEAHLAALNGRNKTRTSWRDL